MSRLATLALVAACSTNQHTAAPPPERPKDASAVVAIDAAATTDARNKDIDDALAAIWSEHPRDIPPAAWWKAHASEVRPPLRALIADGTDDGNGDRVAIQILGDLGDPADVELLAGVLTGWKQETARARAAAALGAHPAPAAGEALIAASKRGDLAIASHAASGLGERKGDAAARARLEELLGHADATMRFRAVNALRELGGSRDALAKRARVEKDAEVKAAIAKALRP